jgi:hypothetical protein
VAHWHDLSDEAVEYEYAALFFLAPAGFRHFLPAYMSFGLFADAQRSAVLAFLEAMISHEDVDEALEYWRSEVRGSRPSP